VQVRETVRYWWDVPEAVCSALSADAPVELLTYTPCCDTVPASEGACAVRMWYAEPISAAIRQRLDAAQK